jgi:hypothetical protein
MAQGDNRDGYVYIFIWYDNGNSILTEGKAFTASCLNLYWRGLSTKCGGHNELESWPLRNSELVQGFGGAIPRVHARADTIKLSARIVFAFCAPLVQLFYPIALHSRDKENVQAFSFKRHSHSPLPPIILPPLFFFHYPPALRIELAHLPSPPYCFIMPAQRTHSRCKSLLVAHRNRSLRLTIFFTYRSTRSDN